MSMSEMSITMSLLALMRLEEYLYVRMFFYEF